MPHSSGGGSSGGGFHGGGGFHSSGSGHSNYNRTPTMSTRYFPGATRYVYYLHHRPYFIYSAVRPDKASYSNSIITLFAALIFFVLPIIIFFTKILVVPTKLSADYNTDIVIEDYKGNLTATDEQSLKECFISFQEKTGITPCLFINGEVDYYSYHVFTFEQYTLRLYEERFTDEKHLLINYSDTSDWKFEVVQGNDTDYILYEELATTFTKSIYNSLSDDKNITSSVLGAFDKISPSLMKPYVEDKTGVIVFAIVWYGVTAFMVYHSIKGLLLAKHMKGAKECPDDATLLHCPYCDTEYYANTIANCPNCGAQLDDYKPEFKPEDNFDSKPEKKETGNAQVDEFGINPDDYKIDEDKF